jgi:hypothetical protein
MYLNTVIFLLFVCLWHVPHPIALWLLRIYGMYICMYVYNTASFMFLMGKDCALMEWCFWWTKTMLPARYKHTFCCMSCHRFAWRCFQSSKTFVQVFLKACILHVLSCLKLNLLLEMNSLMCKLLVLVCLCAFRSFHPCLLKFVHAPYSNLHSSSRCITETLHNLQ